MTDLQITLTRKDIAIARLLFYFRSGLGIVLTILGSVFAVTLVSTLVANRNEILSFHSYLLPVALLVILPASVTLAGLFGPAISKWLTTITYSFSDSGFNVSIPSVSAYFDWTDVRRAIQTKRYIVLSVPGALQIVPLFQLPSDTAKDLNILIYQKTQTPKNQK